MYPQGISSFVPILHALLADPDVRAACDAFRTTADEIVRLAIAIQQIAAPTGYEAERAAWVEGQFTHRGLQGVSMDAVGNVYGYRPGTGGGPGIAVVAHLDTVFPLGTDLTVRHEQGRIYGPGLGDNSLGVAGLLALADVLERRKLQAVGDIWFVADVGEEGLGDLRGMRAATDRLADRVSGMIALEGGGLGMICHQGIAVRRYELQVTAPGGHSWSDFGAPSAVHELLRVGAELTRLHVPDRPRVTFNIGTIEGGTSINALAQRAQLQLDLRAESSVALEALITQVDTVVATARRQVPPEVSIGVKMIGDRPGGKIERDHPLIQLATEVLLGLGLRREQIEYRAGSTDANIPLSRGIPAVCLGLADAENAHRTDEYIDPRRLPIGLAQLLLVTLAGAGGRGA